LANKDPSLAYSILYALCAFGLDVEAQCLENWLMAHLKEHRITTNDARTIWEAEVKQTNNELVEAVAKNIARTAYREVTSAEHSGVDFPIDFGRNMHFEAFLSEKGNEKLKAQVVRWNPTYADQTKSDVKGNQPDVERGVPEKLQGGGDMARATLSEGEEEPRIRALRPEKQQEIYRERLVERGRRVSMPAPACGGKGTVQRADMRKTLGNGLIGKAPREIMLKGESDVDSRTSFY